MSLKNNIAKKETRSLRNKCCVNEKSTAYAMMGSLIPLYAAHLAATFDKPFRLGFPDIALCLKSYVDLYGK
jgi:hypothetical protein